MTRSLRRSRRAPKRVSDYNCGDIVEINRNGTIYKGRLAQLLTEGTSPNPRWLIKFDGQNHKDEEIYERSFGKLIAAYEDDDHNSAGSPITTARKPTKPHVPATRRGSTGKNGGGNSSEGEMADDPRKEKNSAKKVVQFTQGSNTGSDHSATPEPTSRRSARDRVSAREERSRRRQAKIDEETVLPGEPVLGGKRRAPPPPHQAKKRQREETQGEVVKVKLLTGTLYLYRGRNRRAEFIRRV